MTNQPPQKIVVTGAAGLLGWHSCVRLHALNCEAHFNGAAIPFDIVQVTHADFDDPDRLQAAVFGANAVLHFAGQCRGHTDNIAAENQKITEKLISACQHSGREPQFLYANSVHAQTDTPYGRSKRITGERLAGSFEKFTNLILPHIFGEHARPFHNTVTATFIHQILHNETINVNKDGHLRLLHAGRAAQHAIDAISNRVTGDITPKPRAMSVLALRQKLQKFHGDYSNNIYPDLSDDFNVALFNAYRTAHYLTNSPKPLTLHKDARGSLFEAVKGGGGGQSFLSTTMPGITRGNHFHLNKVERFLIIEGEAIIRIRKVFSTKVTEIQVSGTTPTAVDIPTLHTHSLENTGTNPLLSLFWTHRIFDPLAPDTYAEQVLQ